MAGDILKKAFAVKSAERRVLTDEDTELAFAWLRGEITTKQAGVAYGYEKQPGNSLHIIARSLKRAHAHGLVFLKK